MREFDPRQSVMQAIERALRSFLCSDTKYSEVTYLLKTHGLTPDKISTLPQAAVLVPLFEREDGEVRFSPNGFE